MVPRITAQRERPSPPEGPGGRLFRGIGPASPMEEAQYREAKVVVHICAHMALWIASAVAKICELPS